MSILPAVAVASADINPWQHIETQLLTGAAVSITFSSGLAHDLYRLHVAVDNNAGTASYPRATFNNDTTAANYDSQTSKMAGSSGTGVHAIVTADGGTVWMTDVDGDADSMGLVLLVGKSVTGEDGAWFGVRKNHKTTTTELMIGGGQWANSGAKITRIDLVGSSGTPYGVDTSARLEGLAVA